MSFTFSKNDTNAGIIFRRLLNDACVKKGMRELDTHEAVYLSTEDVGDESYYLFSTSYNNKYYRLKYTRLDINEILVDYPERVAAFNETFKTCFNTDTGYLVNNGTTLIAEAFKTMIKDIVNFLDVDGDGSVYYDNNDKIISITLGTIFKKYVLDYPTKNDLYKTNLDGLLLDQYSEE